MPKKPVERPAPAEGGHTEPAPHRTLAEALSLPGADEVEFDPPKLDAVFLDQSEITDSDA